MPPHIVRHIVLITDLSPVQLVDQLATDVEQWTRSRMQSTLYASQWKPADRVAKEKHEEFLVARIDELRRLIVKRLIEKS